MASSFVQFWEHHPTTRYTPMGDAQGGNQPQGSFLGPTPGQEPQILKQPTSIITDRRDSQDQRGYNPTVSSPESGFSFQPQFQQQFYPPYPNTPQMHPTSSQSGIAQVQAPSRSSSLSVASLGAALPDSNYAQTYQSQRFPTGSPNPALAYQLQQTQQFPAQAPINHLLGLQYNMQYHQQYQGAYSAHPQAPVQVQQSGSNPSHQFITSQNFVAPQPVSPYYYQAVVSQFPSHSQSPVYQANPSNPYPAPHGGRGNLPGDVGQISQTRSSNEQPSVIGWQSGGVSARSSSIGVFTNLILVSV
jgi:hypothetical protein